MALTANELRIGNFITVDGITCYVEDFIKDFERVYVVRVVYTTKDEGSVSFVRPIKDLHPIPLSGEVLEAVGFKIDEGGYYKLLFHEAGLYWLKTKMQLSIGYVPIINFECKYLHQLQNCFFALTQTELTYNPSK